MCGYRVQRGARVAPGRTGPRRRLRRWAAAGLVACGVLGGSGAAASAHPFGDPQTLDLRAEGGAVEVRWKAAGDDLTALALDLRVLAEKRTFVYEDGALVPGESDASDAAELAAAPEFGAYLLTHIKVRSGGADCAGRLVSAGNLAEDGALLSFACPSEGPVTAAEVTVTTLTDLHESYRTLARSEGGERHVYTRTAATRTWDLERSGGAPVLPLAGAAAGLVLAGGVAAGVRARRRAAA